MSSRSRKFEAAALAGALALATTSCGWHPFGARSHQTVAIAQVPAPVRSTIELQARGRAVGDIEKQVMAGKTRYEVTLGSGADKATLLIGEDGRQYADDDDDED
nr:hypothetical protein [uncultured Cupriavidus sp.]